MSSNTFVYTASYDLTVRLAPIFREQTVARPHSFSVSTSQVNRMACTEDRKLILAINPYILVYDAANRGKFAQLTGHLTNVNDIACVGARIYSCSEDRTWMAWDPRQGMRALSVCSTGAALNSIAADDSGNYLITANERGQIEAWDVRAAAAPVCARRLSEQPVRSCALAPGRTVVCACHDGFVRACAFDGAAFAEGAAFRAHDDIVLRAVVSPDGQTLVTTSADASAKLWATRDFALLHRLAETTQKEWVWDAAFTADSRFVVTGGTDRAYRTWSVETGEMVYRNAEAHTKGITALCTFEQQ